MTETGFDYIKKVEQHLPGKKAQKKTYLKKLSADVAERLEEEPSLDSAALALAFGSPEELAADFKETLDATEIKKAFIWKHAVVIGVLAIVLIWFVAILIMWIDGHTQIHGRGVETIGDSIISIEEY